MMCIVVYQVIMHNKYSKYSQPESVHACTDLIMCFSTFSNSPGRLQMELFEGHKRYDGEMSHHLQLVMSRPWFLSVSTY